MNKLGTETENCFLIPDATQLVWLHNTDPWEFSALCVSHQSKKTFSPSYPAGVGHTTISMLGNCLYIDWLAFIYVYEYTRILQCILGTGIKNFFPESHDGCISVGILVA